MIKAKSLKCDGCNKAQPYAVVFLCLKCYEQLKKIGWIKKEIKLK